MLIRKFLNELTPDCLTNNMYIILILVLSSCTDMTMMDYSYFVTSMQTNFDTTSPKEQRPLLIRAKSDSDAYLKAYLSFCITQKYYNKEFEKSGALAGRPLSFRLLNEDSVDIAQTVSFINKKGLEKRIEKRVILLELEKDKEN